MKKLKIHRETIGHLTPSALEQIRGGGISIIRVTERCPVMTNGCTGSQCVITIDTGGTSVINPGGG